MPLWPFHRNRSEATPAPGPLPANFIICGFGTHDRLQISVEAERTLVNYGKAFSVGLTPTLGAFLHSLHVQVTELDGCFSAGRPYAEAYLDIVSTLLQRAVLERPVIFLTPGNPLFMNSVARTLLIEARRLGLSVQMLPGISMLDILVNEIGLDVSVYGVQVFDAPWFVARQPAVSTAIPLLLLNLGGIGQEAPRAGTAEAGNEQIRPLVDQLLRSYPTNTEAICLRLRPNSYGVASLRRPLGQLPETEESLANSSLFIDAQPQVQG